MDDTTFFANVRSSLGGGILPQSAVDGINAILDEWARSGDGDKRKLAYILATAWHETGAFRWLHELWGPTAAQKRYEGRADLGNTVAGDGKRFMGRGFVQITGRENYADWSARLGIDLVAKPDRAAEPAIAARIIVQGMLLGTFTGKKLATYITASKADYTNARRVVNGTDKAATIAGHAKKFLAAIDAAETAVPAPAPAEAPIAPTVKTAEPQTTLSWWERLVGVRKPATALVGTNRGDETLFRAQNQLLAAGYTEVGDPDGLWGANTRSAVTAFLAEQAPTTASPTDWPLSDEILAAIAKAERRKVSVDRANVTAAEAVKRGSTPAKSAVTTAGLGLGTLLTGIGGFFGLPDAVDKVSRASDQAAGVLSTLTDVLAFFAQVVGFVIAYRWPILIAIGLYFLARGVRWIAETVIMIRTGSIRQTNL